jgi:spermidine/putrescine transport system permease protein
MAVGRATAAAAPRVTVWSPAWQRRLIVAAIAGPPLLYLFVLYVVPMVGMLAYSFGRTEGVDTELAWNVDQYRRLFGTPEILELLGKSLRMAATVTAVCLIIGFPVAYIVARLVPRRIQYLLLLLLLIPAWTSFIIRTYSWLLVLGNEGLVNTSLQAVGAIDAPLQLAFNEFAVDVALVYINLPWLVLPIYAALEKMEPALLEAGSILGAGRFDLFRRIVLPLSMPGVVAGVLLVFVPAISTFAVPEILGGTGGTMYANLINTYFLNFDWPFGAALATVMLAITLAVVALASRFVRLEELWTR